MFVYVLNKHGTSLMPCKPAKAKKLLKAGKAKVVRGTPFTIKLLYGSGGYKQPITAGMDTGSKTIGTAAIANAQVFMPLNGIVSITNRTETRCITKDETHVPS